MSTLRTLVTSWPDRDGVVVEIWYEDSYMGESFQEGENVVLRWRAATDVILTLDEWTDLLESLRREFGV